MNKLIWSFFVLGIFLSGCGENKNQTPVSNTIPNSESQIEHPTSLSSTSTTFSFEGITLRLPSYFTFSTSSLTFGRKTVQFFSPKPAMRLTIEPITTAPVTDSSASEEVVHTQQELQRIISFIEASTTSQRISNLQILITTNYDVAGGGFYKQAQWFADKKLFTLQKALSEPDIPDTWDIKKQQEVAKTITKIDSIKVGSQTQKETEEFLITLRSIKIE